jgi:hypothetical protein
MRYTQKHPQHTYIKRDVYYFSRVIPSDLKPGGVNLAYTHEATYGNNWSDC